MPDLHKLVDMNDPAAVFEEAKAVAALIAPQADLDAVQGVYEDILQLFAGYYPGYKSCNTDYHDIFHTTDVVLAAVRLVHGAMVAGGQFTSQDVHRILFCSLMHDTGYIQRADEEHGSGAQYTASHIERSIGFVTKYFQGHKEISVDLEAMACILRCTGLNVKIDTIPFNSEKTRFLGCVLGTADLLGQMADRYYVEKLPILYLEFEEGGIPGFTSTLDLIGKTPGFCQMAYNRFSNELGGVNRYMINHFQTRWDIPADLYQVEIDKNLEYINKVAGGSQDYERLLRRRCKFEERCNRS